MFAALPDPSLECRVAADSPGKIEQMLYPLKFRPRLKKRIWGGRLLSERLGKRIPKDAVVGESWEISGVDGDISIVSNGLLAGNNLEELIEVYMGELVGDRVYEKFGLEFPLLIKYIDAQDKLSVQVHPDDKLAAERHFDHGKTEMWYILEAAPDAELYIGFKNNLSQETYNKHITSHTLPETLSTVHVNPGEAFSSRQERSIQSGKESCWPRFSKPPTSPIASTTGTAKMRTDKQENCTRNWLPTPSILKRKVPTLCR